jgi:dihydroorotase
MPHTMLLDPVRILIGSDQDPIEQGAALIRNGALVGFGDDARQLAQEEGIESQSMPKALLAPCLVDPHSVLEQPLNGQAETLESLCRAAVRGGYGQVALLPRAESWRDRIERLQGFQRPELGVRLHLWGGFSCGGRGEQFSAHGDLLEHGAIGLADDAHCPPIPLLQRALVLGDMGTAPLLLAPRDRQIQGDGMVREGVETLRAGWPPDPIASETLPLGQLLELQRQHPERRLCLMNLSTAAGVNQLEAAALQPQASVCWWHLVADSSNLQPTENGWCITPSLGGPKDRKALIEALERGTLLAVAVHAVPLDAEDCLLPPGERRPGLAGHQLVLPALWQELVNVRGWSVRQLWRALSFGPSRLLGQPEERLEIGSNRWLLFDPQQRWRQSRRSADAPLAANQPWEGRELEGQVTACGLMNPEIHCD